MMTRRMCALLLATLTLLILSGCAGPTVQTSRHLRSGEINLSGSLDIPGATIIPRVNGEVMYGLGGKADMSLAIGTTLLSYNAGLGGRVYLGDRFTLGLQAAWTQAVVDDFDGLNGWMTTSMRLTTATDADWPVYGGLSGVAAFAENDDKFGFYSANVGLVGGVERRLSKHTLVQIELTLAPLMIGRDGVALFPGVSTSGDERFSPFIAQLSAAFHWGWHADDDRAKPSPEPAKASPGEPLPDHLRPTRREDTPAPVPQRPPQ